MPYLRAPYTNFQQTVLLSCLSYPNFFLVIWKKHLSILRKKINPFDRNQDVILFTSRLFDIPADYFGRINPVSIFQQDSYLVLATSQELSNSETAKQYISFMQNKQRQRCLLLVLNNAQADKG